MKNHDLKSLVFSGVPVVVGIFLFIYGVRREAYMFSPQVEIEKLCKATEKCVAKTPYNTAEGKKCSLGPDVNRLMSVEDLERAVEKGEIEPSKYTKAISFSSCPTQTFGGSVRLILDTEKIKDKLEPMCYLRYEKPEEKKILNEMDREALRLIEKRVESPLNYVRAKYAVSPDIYERECEYQSREPIKLKDSLKKIEYWIGGVKTGDINIGCERLIPHVAGLYARPEEYVQEIQRVKRVAEKLGVPFEVKSCFNKIRAGWGVAIELTPENLEKMKRGEIPEPKPTEVIPETCKC
ncbi:MAG: hypothetical protein ACXQTI_05505 [Candidatus Nezhaarchaeales archaeon]